MNTAFATIAILSATLFAATITLGLTIRPAGAASETCAPGTLTCTTLHFGHINTASTQGGRAAAGTKAIGGGCNTHNPEATVIDPNVGLLVACTH